MTEDFDIGTRAEAVRERLLSVYGVRGRDFEQALARARRVLPGDVRRAGAQIVEMMAMQGHPQLDRMIEEGRVERAFEKIEVYLASVDVADLRRGRRLAWAGRIAFNLLLILALFLVWAVWSGAL